MAWIESHHEEGVGFWTRNLARRLGTSHVAAVGHVHLLWHYCIAGGVGDLDRLDLEIATEWGGDLGRLVEALTYCGYIEPIGDGRFRVVNWWEIAGKRTHILRERGRMTLRIRKAVIDRDGTTCAECRATADPPHIDHVVPLARGGRTEMDNLQVLCGPCNLAKGDS